MGIIISVISSTQIACDVMWVQYVQKQPTEVFFKKSVLKNFGNFTGKHLRRSLFLTKLQACGRFPVKLAKFLRTPILKNICGRLLLYVIKSY